MTTEGVTADPDIRELPGSDDLEDVDIRPGESREDEEAYFMDPPGLFIIGRVMPFSARYRVTTGPVSIVLATSSANC